MYLGGPFFILRNFLGGIVLPLATDDLKAIPGTFTSPSFLNQTDKYVYVFVSLGDCKAYQISKGGKIVDVTEGNRKNINDPKDPGGRIGITILGGIK